MSNNTPPRRKILPFVRQPHHGDPRPRSLLTQSVYRWAHSWWLRAEDVSDPTSATLERVEEVAYVGRDGVARAVVALYFDQWDKPLLLSRTVARALAAITGKDVPTEWVGARVCIVAQGTQLRLQSGT